ncbi:MAG: peptidoglycan DD-metalloendopeptidase family protein [Cyanobacteria bacterium P01_H01_bin.119]
MTNWLDASLDATRQPAQGSTGNARSVRTSAAMLGLALSVGASGALLPRGAAATPWPTVSLNPTLSTVPANLGDSVEAMALSEADGVAHVTYHTVQSGQTLSQIAALHGVDIAVIEQANGVSEGTLLQVGQVLKVPSGTVSQTISLSGPEAAPETVSEAQLDQQLAFAEADAQQKTSQDVALANLQDKRQSLQEALKPESSVSAALADEADVFDAIAASPDAGAVEPDVNWSSSSVSAQAIARSEAVKTETQAAESNSPADATQAESDVLDDNQSGIARLTPEQLTAPEAPMARPAAQQYEILPGDTVGDIAERYGVSTAALIHLNDLVNADVIVAGDQLLIPERGGESVLGIGGVNYVAVLENEVSSVGSDDQFSNDRLSQLRATVLSPVEGEAELQRLREAVLGSAPSAETVNEFSIEPSGADDLSSADEVAGTTEDSYMANLMAEVSAAQQLVVEQPNRAEVTAAESATLAAAEPETGAATEALTESGEDVAVNPHFLNRAVGGDRAIDAPTSAPLATDLEAQLLATAPLGSEVYAPINRPAAGQVVSPNMPALPSSDEFLPEVPSYFNGYIWPTTGTLTSGYGPRWGRMHHGIDVAGPVGTPIVAAAPGTIERAGWNSGGYGNLVDIRHNDGSLTRYAHNSRLLVRPGQQVSQGQQIAEMGSTGYSTGPHLHFEVHLPGQGTVNPMAHLPGR